MNCAFHPARPADAATPGACSRSCEAALYCCGQRKHESTENGRTVLRCLTCRSAETISLSI